MRGKRKSLGAEGENVQLRLISDKESEYWFSIIDIFKQLLTVSGFGCSYLPDYCINLTKKMIENGITFEALLQTHITKHSINFVESLVDLKHHSRGVGIQKILKLVGFFAHALKYFPTFPELGRGKIQKFSNLVSF